MRLLDSNQLKKPKLICIGEALLDRLGPPGGDPQNDYPVEDCLGGAPANVACALARLGTPVAFCGRLGKDEIGNKFIKLMQSRGITLAGLQTDSIRPSRVVLVRRDIYGERVFQGFQGDRGDGFADQGFELKNLIDAWPLLRGDCDWLLLGTIPLASLISAETLLWSVDQAMQNNIKIALDVNWRPTFWDPNASPDSGPSERALREIFVILKKTSLLKLAKEEAIWFFKTSDPVQISQSLPQQPDVVVTDGPRPIRWFLGGFVGVMPVIPPKIVVDSTGAGDAFFAGLLQQLSISSKDSLTEEKVLEIMRFAAICGALVCEGSGAIDPQPNQEQVQSFISSELGGDS